MRRPSGTLLHPAADRLLAAAARLGYPPEPDKNGGDKPGAGLVPANAVDGVRADTASAYPSGPLPGLTVRGDAAVVRVLIGGTRARGVELAGGTVIEAPAARRRPAGAPARDERAGRAAPRRGCRPGR